MIVSRVQVAERYVRAVDEQDAARKVQEELDRPYSFLGGWRTVDTDLDVVEADSPLEKAPVPLAEDGTLLMPASGPRRTWVWRTRRSTSWSTPGKSII